MRPVTWLLASVLAENGHLFTERHLDRKSESGTTELPYSLRVATIEVLEVSILESDGFVCRVLIRKKDGSDQLLVGRNESTDAAVAQALSILCTKQISVASKRTTDEEGHPRFVVSVAEVSDGANTDSAKPKSGKRGVGRYVADPEKSLQNIELESALGLVIASLRAASHAGMLKADYRANNQKIFRAWSSELIEELKPVLQVEELDELRQLEAEGVILEHTNRVASAAVVTAANYPKPESILSLFDTSAWLFDSRGQRRDAYTETDLWLAWYPGIRNGKLTVDEVIESMPKAPPSKIPWIVKVFENPDSWIRFRGAVDLEDHDVLHVLLGRGLQDQDEAFVIGFAMGTAKKVSAFQYWVLKFVLARLYPEPYRIPRFLQPAFDLGVKCGQETGSRDLYKRHLKDLRSLSLDDARSKAEIDLGVLKKYFDLEQQRIPFTIASLRLP